MTHGSGWIDDPTTLARTTRLYDQAARLAKIGAWECDLATERLTWTAGVYELFEHPLEVRPKRREIIDLYVDEWRHHVEAIRAETIASGRSAALDAQIRTMRGNARWIRLTIDVAFENGRAARLFGAKQDITSEHEAWDRLRHMAEHDPLTGLANRAKFDALYRGMIGDHPNHGALSALVLIDLDRFKAINDRLGHLAGDECLRQVAVRLRRAFADAPLVARIGGDEFAVLLRVPLDRPVLERMLRRCAVALCRPIVWKQERIAVGASIGATMLNRPHQRGMSDLFAEADGALYAAKGAGASVHIFGDVADPATMPFRSRCRG